MHILLWLRLDIVTTKCKTAWLRRESRLRDDCASNLEFFLSCLYCIFVVSSLLEGSGAVCLLQPSHCVVKPSTVRQADWWVIGDCVCVCVWVCIMCIYFGAPDVPNVFISHWVHTQNTHAASLVGEKMATFTQQAFILNSEWLLMSFVSFLPRWHFTLDISCYIDSILLLHSNIWWF